MLTGDKKRWKQLDYSKLRWKVYCLRSQRDAIRAELADTARRPRTFERRMKMATLTDRFNYVAGDLAHAKAAMERIGAELEEGRR